MGDRAAGGTSAQFPKQGGKAAAAAAARERDQAEEALTPLQKAALAFVLLSIAGDEGEENARQRVQREALAAARRVVALAGRGMWRVLRGRREGVKEAVDAYGEARTEGLAGELSKQAVTWAKEHHRGAGDGESRSERAEAATRMGRAAGTGALAREQIALADSLTGKGGLLEGVALRKIWVSRGDEKVRLSHRRLHGDNRALDGDFFRWPGAGGVLAYPGDPRAPLDETANCRCHLVFAPAGELAETEPPPIEPADLTTSFDLARL